VPEGKITVVGKIITIKPQDSMYGTTLKILVESADGWRVWGTYPTALDEAGRGDTVRFNATVERSGRDRDFGFFKRPTQCSIVERATTDEEN
jgi:hypothetical protein